MSIVVKKLTKTYKVKKGADVRALKGISFNLPDMGLVYILGKSGCGKSTLLNVLGGIDSFDGGDIVVDGKSIRGYKERDMDAYRNDYVGFVFQENNLLEADSVRRNVSLALDLQSLKDKEGKVDAALESVGLKEYSDRKCNSISGGQKQRVAIARALIKQPKLLLCDEPTGALDSETGAGIFTLLKQLSVERLVVVVSHDRESAEKYGDRVIELKDGEIISDTAPLSDVCEVRPAEDKKKRGGLRLARAFRLGLDYIITRPVRMAICMLLCVLTFMSVGTVDTVNSYDRDKALYYTMEHNDRKVYVFGRARKNEDADEYNINVPFMTKSQADNLCPLLDVERCDYLYSLGTSHTSWGMCEAGYSFASDEMTQYAQASCVVEADAQFLADYGFPLLAGKLPENTSEVAIPRHLFNFFKTFGYTSGDKVSKIDLFDDLLGRIITFDDGTYSSNGGIESPRKRLSLKVTGIVDTFFNYEKQAEVLFNGAPEYGSDADGFRQDMFYINHEMIYNMLFTCKGFYSYFDENFVTIKRDDYIERVIAPYKGSESQKMKNIRVYTTQFDGKPVSETNNNYSCYKIIDSYSWKIYFAEVTFSEMKLFGPYIIAVAIAITVLFVVYYASGTVNDKKREIGILRALGASRGDIAKISACEHLTFTAVAIAISSAVAVVATAILNHSLTKGYGFAITLIRFGIRQFGIMSGVALLSILVGVAIPLIKLFKLKPVDVIADRK